MIQIDNLFVKYDNLNILEDINLQLAEGSVCAVIGPSGAEPEKADDWFYTAKLWAFAMA